MEADQSESLSDFAIAKFTQSLSTDNPNSCLEDLEFTHWTDIIQKIHNIWNKSYANHLKILNSQKEVENHYTKFSNEINRIYSKRPEYLTMKKYFEYVINHEIDSLRYGDDSEHKENKQLDQQKQQFIDANEGLNKSLFKKKISIQVPKLADLPLNLIKTWQEPEILHLIRGHSKDNNINDNSTPVTDVAFELASVGFSLNDLPSYTNICATSGQNIINLIDVETGKIVKRFSDEMCVNRVKEVYFKLAWTILNNISVLVAGGLHGQIKVIVPKHSLCISRFDAHDSQISFLMFHPKYPDLLLTASDDHQIKIWRLEYKDALVDLECECSVKMIGCINYNRSKSNKNKEAVLDMCFIPNDYLLISTLERNYCVHLNEDKLFKTFTTNKPNQKFVDDAVKYMTNDLKDENSNDFEASPLYIEGISENKKAYEENIIINKMIFVNNLLLANVINSIFIYKLSIVFENDNLTKLQVMKHFKIGDEKTPSDVKLNVYKNYGTIFILKPSANGAFYQCLNDKDLNTFSIYKCKVPANYSIRKLNDPLKVNVKNYGLLPAAKVFDVVSNGKYIVLGTDQNIITIWKAPFLKQSTNA